MARVGKRIVSVRLVQSSEILNTRIIAETIAANFRKDGTSANEKYY